MKGGTAYHFMAATESVSIDEGVWEGSGEPLINGARVWEQRPKEDGIITLEMYPTDLLAADNTGYSSNGLEFLIL